MFIKKAWIISKHAKTDDELKAILATRPIPEEVYGFFRYGLFQRAPGDPPHAGDIDDIDRIVDAVWSENGVSSYERDRKWIIRDHKPELNLLPLLTAEQICGPEGDNERAREKRWWAATVELIMRQIPCDYCTHSVFYGEREDEWGGPELPEPEPDRRRRSSWARPLPFQETHKEEDL